ncbi:MAG: hypothetical protein Q8N14_02600, partial [Candidatus Omnitrophota bacterium]|nr:hypothetical protein [Candidatus Omnitrophota bacterium]
DIPIGILPGHFVVEGKENNGETEFSVYKHRIYSQEFERFNVSYGNEYDVFDAKLKSNIIFSPDGRILAERYAYVVDQVATGVLGTVTQGYETVYYDLSASYLKPIKGVVDSTYVDGKLVKNIMTKEYVSIEFSQYPTGEQKTIIIVKEAETKNANKVYLQRYEYKDGKLVPGGKSRVDIVKDYKMEQDDIIKTAIGLIAILLLIGLIGRLIKGKSSGIKNRQNVVNVENPNVKGYQIWLSLSGKDDNGFTENEIDRLFDEFYEKSDKLKDCPDFIFYLMWRKRTGAPDAEIQAEIQLWYDIITANQNFAHASKVTNQHRLLYDDVNNLFRTREFLRRYEQYRNISGVNYYRNYVNLLTSQQPNYAGKKKEAAKFLELLHYKTDAKKYKAKTQGWQLPKESIIWKTYRSLDGGFLGIKGWLAVARNFFNQISVYIIGLYLVLLPALDYQFTSTHDLINPALGLVILVGILKVLYGVLNAITSVKFNPPSLDYGYQRPKDKQWFKEQAFIALTLLPTFAMKFIWNYFTIKWVVTPALIYLESHWNLTGWDVLGGNYILTAILLIPFLGFYIVDTMFFFYLVEATVGYLRGKYIGLGKVKSWKAGVKLFEQAKQKFAEKFIPETLGFAEPEKEQIFRDIWNEIIMNIHLEDRLSELELHRYSFDEGGNIDLSIAPEDKEAEERLNFFITSLFMKTYRLPDTWEQIRSHVVVTPANNEPIYYSKKELNEVYAGSETTFLCALIALTLNQWLNFKQRMQNNGGFTAMEIAQLQEIYQQVMSGNKAYQLENISDNLWKEVKLWASYRFQPLIRTVRGIEYRRLALKAIAKYIYFRRDPITDAELKAEVNRKFKYVASYQIYGEQLQVLAEPANKTEAELDKAAFIVEGIGMIMELFPDVFVAYLTKPEGTSVLLQNNIEIDRKSTLGHFWKEPDVTQGKPEHQKVLSLWTEGYDYIDTVDMNQDDYFEEALKHPLVLEEHRPDV